MLNWLKSLFCKPLPETTSTLFSEEFDEYFKKKLFIQTIDCYTFALVGSKHIAHVKGQYKMYKDREKALRKLAELREANPKTKIELRKITFTYR